MTQSITHRNHYIPRFYLKNWSLDGKTILTYSILVSNSKVPYWTQQSIKNSAVWNDFYTRMEGDKEVDDFEHWFDRKFETPVKPVFDKLLNDQKISREESIILSHFVFAMIFSITHHCINTIMESYFFICHCHLRKDQRAINRESICVIIGYEIILRPDNLPSR